MKNRLGNRLKNILIVILTVPALLLAQQGVIMIKDGAANRRASVSGFNALYVTPIDAVSGTGFTPVTDVCDGLTKTTKRYISVGSGDNESQVVAAAATLCGIMARNANASTAAFLKCTNATAANTTPGSTAVAWDMIVPVSSGFVAQVTSFPFSTAITCYIVTGKADSDATDAAADDVSYVLTYVLGN